MFLSLQVEEWARVTGAIGRNEEPLGDRWEALVGAWRAMLRGGRDLALHGTVAFTTSAQPWGFRQGKEDAVGLDL